MEEINVVVVRGLKELGQIPASGAGKMTNVTISWLVPDYPVTQANRTNHAYHIF